MNKTDLYNYAKNIINNDPGNIIGEDVAISPDLAGMRIYDEILMACQDADDPYFVKLKEDGIIGPHFIPPNEWLTGAKSVISFFFPFTERVRLSNRAGKSEPSSEWLHGRFEGQKFIGNFCDRIKDYIKGEGYSVVIPSMDERFKARSPVITDKSQQGHYTSNWSERHVAFICGLGTFGLSKGLITEKGVAGRYASFVTDCELEYTTRHYADIYEYCTMCGACAINCPADAISIEKGKNHPICSAYLNRMQEIYSPRYGCGKCQTKVPCEYRIPASKR